MSVEIAVIGAQRPFVLEELERDFTVHRVWEAADKVAALAPVAARVRGVVTHAMAGLSKGLIEARPSLRTAILSRLFGWRPSGASTVPQGRGGAPQARAR